MRILYITSGMLQPYPHRFIDKFITQALGELPEASRVFELNTRVKWQQTLLTELGQFVPDYVFTIHGVNLTPEVVQQIRHGGTKMGIWLVDDPYDIDESKHRLNGYDFVFTNELAAVPVYRRRGLEEVHYLALGTGGQYFFPETPPAEYRSDICIVGSPYPRRVQLVNWLVQKLPHLRWKVVGPGWGEYGISPQVDLIPHYVGPEEVRKLYNGAKINLNIHRDAGEQYAAGVNLNAEGIPAESPNNRTFDIAACRAFQLVDFRPVLSEFYQLDSEMITFANYADLLVKVVRYVGAEAGRKEVAERAYSRTLREHGFLHRLKRMIAIVRKGIIKQVAAQFHAGTLVKDDRPQVYLIWQGRKHLLPSEECFARLGGVWERVQVWQRERVDAVPAGVELE